MIPEWVEAWEKAKPAIRKEFESRKCPSSYEEIVKIVIGKMFEADNWGDPDKDRIHVIDDGNYQGTLLFVIASSGYQPDKYWVLKVSYGSCSGCDTLAAIDKDGDWNSGLTSPGQVGDLMTLALHIVQSAKEI